MKNTKQIIADIEDAERAFDDAAMRLVRLMFDSSTNEQLQTRSDLYYDLLDNIHTSLRATFPNHCFRNF